MSNLAKAEAIAEKLRREPYRLFRNDCLAKTRRLKRLCREAGVPAKGVACIGLAQARFFGRWMTIPVVHGWGEVEGKRIETSRPLGATGIWGIVPMHIRPILVIHY